MNPAALPPRMTEKITRVQRGDWDCWQWNGCRNPKGYGNVTHNGRLWLTHRLTYTLLVGEIPEGLQIDHLCKYTSCCNPAHLEPVTAKENNARKYECAKDRCVHGHPLAGVNLRIKILRNGESRRVCRVCNIDHLRRYRQRNGAIKVHPKTLRRRAAILQAAERSLAEQSAGSLLLTS
ncbi:HNH endonuclease [Gordonia phage Gudmit]|nr:HNH endonuclease [Gordonia phage Gudmit]